MYIAQILLKDGSTRQIVLSHIDNELQALGLARLIVMYGVYDYADVTYRSPVASSETVVSIRALTLEVED